MQDQMTMKAFFDTPKAQKFTRFSKVLETLVTQFPIPVIVFCDPGVDDILMILQLLGSQKIYTIVGIVPVKGNASAEICTQNTLDLCEYVGRSDVPVYPGKKAAMTGAPVYGDNALGGLTLPRAQHMKAQSTPGIEFTVEFLKTHKALLISTACLTEPAEVLDVLAKKNPEALGNIIGVSLMGGVINASQEANFPVGEKRLTEANVGDDPHGTKVFFDIAAQHNIKIFLSSLDLTHSILVSKTDIASLEHVNNRAAKCAYMLMIDVPPHYKKRYERGPDGEYRQPVHDAHATTCLLHSELYRGRWVEIEVSKEISSKHFSIKKEGTGNIFLLSIPTMDRGKYIEAMMGDYKNFTSCSTNMLHL